LYFPTVFTGALQLAEVARQTGSLQHTYGR